MHLHMYSTALHYLYFVYIRHTYMPASAIYLDLKSCGCCSDSNCKIKKNVWVCGRSLYFSSDGDINVFSSIICSLTLPPPARGLLQQQWHQSTSVSYIASGNAGEDRRSADMSGFLRSSVCAGGHAADGYASLQNAPSAYKNDYDVDRENRENGSSGLAGQGMLVGTRSGRVRRRSRRGRLTPAAPEETPSTPPPLPGRRRGATAASPSTDATDDDNVIEEQQEKQQQQQKEGEEEQASRIPRSVSFCEVVKVSPTAMSSW